MTHFENSDSYWTLNLNIFQIHIWTPNSTAHSHLASNGNGRMLICKSQTITKKEAHKLLIKSLLNVRFRLPSWIFNFIKYWLQLRLYLKSRICILSLGTRANQIARLSFTFKVRIRSRFRFKFRAWVLLLKQRTEAKTKSLQNCYLMQNMHFRFRVRGQIQIQIQIELQSQRISTDGGSTKSNKDESSQNFRLMLWCLHHGLGCHWPPHPCQNSTTKSMETFPSRPSTTVISVVSHITW